MRRTRSVPFVALGALVVALTPLLAAAQTPSSAPNQGGARVEAAKGKSVRLTETSGTRQSGRLLSITATGVVLHADGREVTVPIASVRKIERVSHAVRNGAIAGAIAGFIYGYGVTEEDGSGSSREVKGGTLIGAVGAAGGAGIGALIARARRGHNLVFASTTAKTSLTAMPIWSPGRTGFSVAVRW